VPGAMRNAMGLDYAPGAQGRQEMPGDMAAWARSPPPVDWPMVEGGDGTEAGERDEDRRERAGGSSTIQLDHVLLDAPGVRGIRPERQVLPESFDRLVILLALVVDSHVKNLVRRPH